MNNAVAILTHLNEVWKMRMTNKSYMFNMEQTLADILNLPQSEADDKLKVAMCKTCIDAFTRRGHFDAASYTS